MEKARLHLRVNGEDREVLAPVHHTLLEVLREELALTGTKHGCELGECGTCTVLLDGRPVLSCVTLPVECEGREVKTVEGMAHGAQLHPLTRLVAPLQKAVPCRTFLVQHDFVRQAKVEMKCARIGIDVIGQVK